MVQAPPSATSGVAELDRALGGLYWGDNVVWMAEHAEAVAPFYAALGATATDYHYAAYVAVADDLDEVATRFPRLRRPRRAPWHAARSPRASHRRDPEADRPVQP